MKRAMKLGTFVLTLAVAVVSWGTAEGPAVSASEALQRLQEGNKRYVEATFANPNRDAAARGKVAHGQTPFAIVLGCADSRVPPEILFDQGLGDLFVVRTAGHVADDAALGSIEYAAEHLKAPLLVVLGHERCGAVKAAVDGGKAPGHIGNLVKAIGPAVKKAKGEKGDLLDNAVRENVLRVLGQVKASKPLLAHLIKEGKFKVLGARYDLDTGVVEFYP